jgi:hypothetical protein
VRAEALLVGDPAQSITTMHCRLTHQHRARRGRLLWYRYPTPRCVSFLLLAVAMFKNGILGQCQDLASAVTPQPNWIYEAWSQALRPSPSSPLGILDIFVVTVVVPVLPTLVLLAIVPSTRRNPDTDGRPRPTAPPETTHLVATTRPGLLAYELWLYIPTRARQKVRPPDPSLVSHGMGLLCSVNDAVNVLPCATCAYLNGWLS